MSAVTVIRNTISTAFNAPHMTVREGHGINGNEISTAKIGQNISLDVRLDEGGLI